MRVRLLWIIGFLFIAFALLPQLTGFVTDWMWFSEVGYVTVYRAELLTKFLLFAGALVIAYFFLTLNARIAVNELSNAPVLWRVNPELPPVDIGKSLSKLVKPISAVVAFLFAVTAASSWMEILQVTHRTSFGVVDPVFGKDI